jgi:hypothetical protein
LLIDFLVFVRGVELLFEVGLKFTKGIRFDIITFKLSISIYFFYNKLSIFMSMNVKVKKFIGVAAEFLSHFC